jgi:hypothetical protein
MMARNLSNVTFVSGKLNHHVASGHEGRKPYKCHICNYSSSEKGEMNNHVHERKEPFKCDICDYSCTRKSSETTIPESTDS